MRIVKSQVTCKYALY